MTFLIFNMGKRIQCVLACMKADQRVLCSFPQVPLFIPVSFTIICLFTVAMSFYSDPVNISIGCTMVLSGFPVYYLVIHRQMSNRCRSLLCKYALGLRYPGPKHIQGRDVGLLPVLISNTNCSMTNRPRGTSVTIPVTPSLPFLGCSLHGQREGAGCAVGGWPGS